MSKFSKLPKVENPNIFIGVPLTKDMMVHAETAGYCAILNQHPSVKWGFVAGMSPEYSRNTMLESHFHLDPCWTHILFLDNDVVPPPDAARNLLRIEADVAVGLTPIVADGRLVWNISIQKEQCWLGMEEELPKEPFEIYSSGAGCLLVRREVLVKMGYPWFKAKYQEMFKNDGQGIEVGEDVFFIRKAMDCGFRIIAHPEVQCKHYNQVDLLKHWHLCKEQLNGSGV